MTDWAALKKKLNAKVQPAVQDGLSFENRHESCTGSVCNRTKKALKALVFCIFS